MPRGRKPIIDEFTPLIGRYSRERVRQMRRQSKGLCVRCDEKRVTAFHCIGHAVEYREYQREYQGHKGRYHSLTYRLTGE